MHPKIFQWYDWVFILLPVTLILPRISGGKDKTLILQEMREDQ